MSSPSSEYIPEDALSAEAPKSSRKSAKGRKLMRWNPERDQLVLLAVEYIASRDGIEIDWNAVGKEVEDHLTGDAIKQHLFKLRAARDAANQKNPPKLDRKTIVAARKKSNPLLDTTSKAPKPPKRRAKNDNDDEEYEEKPGPKTTGLLHLKADKSSKTSPKKRKMKEESDDDLGIMPSKPSKEDKPTPAKKKKAPLPPNFPEEAAPPAPVMESRQEMSVWAPPVFDPQAIMAGDGTGEDDLDMTSLDHAGGGAMLEGWDGNIDDLFLDGGAAAPGAPVLGSEELTLPSQAGGLPEPGGWGDGLAIMDQLPFFDTYGQY